MMWHANGMAGWQFLMMIMYPLVFAGLLTMGVVLVFRTVRPETAARTDAPQRLLAERYARGELTDDEYRQRLDTLRHT